MTTIRVQGAGRFSASVDFIRQEMHPNCKAKATHVHFIKMFTAVMEPEILSQSLQYLAIGLHTEPCVAKLLISDVIMN